jgi:signal transduction histidine kinase
VRALTVLDDGPDLTFVNRNRLTALWYYTRGLEHDKPFLAHLRETLDLVQELIPYDTIILGIMDKDVYTRLVTTNIATAILSRRESTCAHTINQPSGTTFNIPDMAADPRFSGSPPVAGGVITTYAGANLRFSIARANGQPEEVVLGALCAANFTLGRSLSPLQERALVRFADMIVHEIIERARTIRATERHTMAACLATITAQVNAANAVDVVLGALRSTYPHADVSLQSRPDGTILINGTSPLPYHKFKHYLYEDSAQIEKDILAYNHLPSDVQASTRTLRAIAIKRAAVPHTYLVVQTAQLTHIFDDVDAAFVHSCSLILCNVHQAAQLERATAARTAFLRGVSHELRTPIHALLSSCELLVEDARSAPLRLSAQFAANGGQSAEDHAALLANAIASGRQLMATVNNLLNLDALDALSPTPAPFFLAALEAMLVAQVDATLRDSGARVRIVCEHLLPPDVHILNGDFDLLKQALTALLDNAVTFTELGTITLRTTLEGGDETQLGSLVYDVIDTGPGIAADVGVVFDAVEKDAGGIGIGLSVARRVARALGGQLELRRTSSDGSWFRLRLDAPVLACRPSHPAQRISRSTRLRTFAFAGAVNVVQAQMLRAMLTAVGLKETTQNAAALVIVDVGVAPPLEGKQVALVLRPSDDGTSLPWPRAVPLIQPVCAEVLWAALGAALDVREQDPDVAASSSSSSSSSLSPSSSVGTSEPKGESDIKRSRRISIAAPTRATLRILIVDDNVRLREA